MSLICTLQSVSEQVFCCLLVLNHSLWRYLAELKTIGPYPLFLFNFLIPTPFALARLECTAEGYPPKINLIKWMRTMNTHSTTKALVGIWALAALVANPAIANTAAEKQKDPLPDFGPNVTIFKPSTPLAQINQTLQRFSAETEFSTNRHAVFFMPGTYGSAAGQDDPATATGIVNAEVGYYTAIYGLGRSPEDVRINGALHVEPVQYNPAGNPQDDNLESNSLTQFWRSLSNLTINPIQRPVGKDAERPYPEGIAAPHTLRWAVSQAAPLRRVNVLGDLQLSGQYGAYAFGTYMANSRVRGSVISGDGKVQKAQAHWYTRNSSIGYWDGRAVNYMFSGVDGAPVTDFDPGSITSLPTTPASREAPFIYVDSKNNFNVFVPHAKTHTSGFDWSASSRDGRQLPIQTFYIAKPSDSAVTINRQLRAGKNIVLTPGIYMLSEALKVSRPDTVILGLGFPSLVAANGTAAIEVANITGVMLSGLLIEAGPINSNVLLKIGEKGSYAGESHDPTTVSDVFVRIGGPLLGQATTSIEVNNNNVILDHTWLWRADHGTGAGWDSNKADHGLVVNGDDVNALGLFVEHYQKNQVIWNGERGRTLFYQSEMPYDPPSQAAWKNGDKDGFASYVVGSAVKSHEAAGLAIYSLFVMGQNVHASSAIEAPATRGIRLKSISSSVIAGDGGIWHVVNDQGPAALANQPNSEVYRMTSVIRLQEFPIATPRKRDRRN
ncbi:adenylyl cyclase [Pseudomonas sp. GV071]|uniref:adenylyl cyclase n=1 Tax=Pseudomonas sp. GV071 TaxID=2135754 RepID=UPI0011B1D432|nr:adenylyl cyclase [Pseudomonas sp. GV071]